MRTHDKKLGHEDLITRIAMRGPKANARFHAMLAVDKENEARPGAVKIQPDDVKYVALLADKVQDVNQFLELI